MPIVMPTMPKLKPIERRQQRPDVGAAHRLHRVLPHERRFGAAREGERPARRLARAALGRLPPASCRRLRSPNRRRPPGTLRRSSGPRRLTPAARRAHPGSAARYGSGALREQRSDQGPERPQDDARQSGRRDRSRPAVTDSGNGDSGAPASPEPAAPRRRRARRPSPEAAPRPYAARAGRPNRNAARAMVTPAK